MKYSKLSDYTIKKILRNFCVELTATQTAKLMNINRHTVDRYYQIFRERIAEYEESSIKQLSGNIEIDESYFCQVFFLLDKSTNFCKSIFVSKSSIPTLLQHFV